MEHTKSLVVASKGLAPSAESSLDEIKFYTKANRPLSGVSIFRIREPVSEELMSRIRGVTARCALGNKEIWNIFPELRRDFSCRVLRATRHDDVVHTVRLGETVLGDVLASPEVWLDEGGRAQMWTPAGFSTRVPAVPDAPVPVPTSDLREGFPHLFEDDVCPQALSGGTELHFCDRFSLRRASQARLPEGVKFISRRALFRDTDLRRVLDQNEALAAVVTQMEGTPPKFVPSDFSGAFLIDGGVVSPEFGMATINRVMAAAALVDGTSGVLVGNMRVHETGGLSWSGKKGVSAPFPFAPPRDQEAFTHDESSGQFAAILDLIARTSSKAFDAAKEDFRLLALETAADARASNVAPVRYVQMWMAIERLLSFRNEISSQLSMCLTALVSIADRSDEFARIKSAYTLRSNIAHGYAFKRDVELQAELTSLSEYFRRLFLIALRVGKPFELERGLREHVLTGQPLPIDAS